MRWSLETVIEEVLMVDLRQEKISKAPSTGKDIYMSMCINSFTMAIPVPTSWLYVHQVSTINTRLQATATWNKTSMLVISFLRSSICLYNLRMVSGKSPHLVTRAIPVRAPPLLADHLSKSRWVSVEGASKIRLPHLLSVSGPHGWLDDCNFQLRPLVGRKTCVSADRIREGHSYVGGIDIRGHSRVK